MFRRPALALLFLAAPLFGAVQPLGLLHIKVVVVDRQRQATPVPRHALLISDNPASAPPRRIFTSADGTVDVRLPPGNYTVESDRPVAFDGKAYQWTQLVDIVAGRDAVLELTADNAEIVPVTSAAASATQPMEADASSLLARWQDSVVAIWTATSHGSGFVIDANGLIATDQQVIGAATSVEVQLSPSVKVAGIVITSDAMRGVGLIKIDPSIAALAKALPLECDTAAGPLTKDQEIAALEAPLGRPPGTASGSVDSILANVIDTDLVPSTGGTGGPAFAPDGRLIGLTTLVNEGDAQGGARGRIVRVGRVCEVVALAGTKIKDAAPPTATRLPVEPVQPVLTGARRDAAPRRPGSLNPYQMSSSDFDIAFITPLQIDATEDRPELARPLFDFRNWSEYVADRPQVLLVRVTPKLVEGFWTKVGRAAASTQGVALPAFKHPKSGFSRLKAFCGETEITPIHPFKLEQRLSATEAIFEGLYVFDPGAFAPSCASVTLVLYSEKEPEKPDTLVMEAKVVQQIWQDFAPPRAIQ